jgi:ankyrin repeat protein
MLALLGNNTEIAEMLIENGVDIGTVSLNTGQSALHIAINRGLNDISRLLIEEGINTNRKDKQGRTPFIIAVQANNAELLSLLPNPKNIDEAYLNSGFSPLTDASRLGNVASMGYLINHKADVNFTTKSSTTPLLQAAGSGNVDAVSLLLEHGADITVTSRSGTTALLNAAELGHTDIINLLLSKNADINAVDNNGAREHIEAVEMLIAHGADIRLKDQKGKTAFDYIQPEQKEQLEPLLRVTN